VLADDRSQHQWTAHCALLARALLPIPRRHSINAPNPAEIERV